MKIKLLFLSLSLTTTTQCVQSLEKLAVQEYCKNLSRVLQDLREYRLNTAIQEVVKKQLINTYWQEKVFRNYNTNGISLSQDFEYILTIVSNLIVVADENQTIARFIDYYHTNFRTLTSECGKYTFDIFGNIAILSGQQYWMSTKANGEPVITLEQVIEKIQNSKTIF